MKNIYTIAALVASMTFQSCSDMMTELNPNNTTSDNYWKNLDETNSTLTSVYNALYNHALLTIEGSTLSSDMGYPGYGRNGNTTNTALTIYYDHTFTSSSPHITDKWAALYEGIKRANQVIEGLENLENQGSVSVDNKEYISQMAQARFFRGLFHFYLHSVYNNGNIIYYDFVPKNNSDFYQSLTPAAEVQERFREDLVYAYENLPISYSSKDAGRITKGAAATILGISHVYASEFIEAEPYFEDVINNCGYSLASAEDLFTSKTGELTCESIFEVCYSAGLKPELGNYDEHSLTNRLGATYTYQSFTVPSWLLNSYQNEEMDMLDPRNTVTNAFKVVGKEVFPRTSRVMPLRGSSMIASIDCEDVPYYLSEMTTESAQLKVSDNNGVAYYRKYTNWDSVSKEDEAGEGRNKSGKNVTVNRLSEVYLLYAECLLERGEVDEALKYINAIRKRWGLVLRGPSNGDATRTYDEVAYSEETLMDLLRYVEKPLELSAEGHFIRSIDLRRWNIAKDNFLKLSEDTYVLLSYSYIATKDKNPTNGKYTITTTKKSFMQPENGEAKTVPRVGDYYKPAAENYDVAGAGYWPIPLAEVQNNPNLYK